MPAAVVAPAIAGAASIASGVLGSRSQNKATKAQQDSNAAALQFEREKEATRQKNYADAMDQYKNAWSAWNSGRLAGLQHYGFDTSAFTSPSAPMGGAAPAAAMPAAGPAQPVQGTPGVGNVPLRMYAPQPESMTQGTDLAALLGRRPMVQ